MEEIEQGNSNDDGLDTGLACVVLLARYFGLPADPAALRHRFGTRGEPLDLTAMLRVARILGLQARSIDSDWSRLARTALPAVGRHVDGHYFVIAKLGDGKVLVQDPGEPGPRLLDREAFLRDWSGALVLFRRRAVSRDRSARFGIGWFVPAIVKYRAILCEVLVASFFLQLFALVTPLFFQVVIDKVLVHRGLTTLDVLALGLLVVSVFDAVLGGLRGYLFTHTTSRIDVALGAKLFRHVVALPVAYFAARRVGDTVARVRELDTIRNFLTSSALTVVVDLLFTVVFIAVMYLYSAGLTFIVLGAMPFYLAVSILITPALRARLNEKFERGADSQAFLVESVSGIETLKSMAVEPQLEPRWEEQLAAYVRASFRASILGNVANQTASLINKVTVVLILWIGARQVMEGDLSVGQLIAFNMLAARTSGPVLRLVQIWQDFQQAGISLQRLGDILNTPVESSYSPNRTALPRLVGQVTFDHVTFRYRPDGPLVLAGVDLRVPRGCVVGVVGPSGSGKSTLGRLLQRLYAPESGRVLVDGVDLALVDPAWLRRQVGVVLQESLLFNRSVRDNIALAEPGMATERVVAAARMAGAHGFILELPLGYDTVVGERGVALSGGQRQRIAIARTLATEPRILILDEATSALDYESERVLQTNMSAIARGRTVFIIAHRLTALRGCDRIIVLEKGRIIESGSHAELMAQLGRYARLHAYQTDGHLSAVGEG